MKNVARANFTQRKGKWKMKTGFRWLLIVFLTGGVASIRTLADEANPPVNPPPTTPELIDNFYLDASVGGERPPGEDSTAFGTFGFNWGIPLTQPEQVAFGLQLGADIKPRDDDPEFNVTFGGFARNFRTFRDQQGAFAALIDYRRTAFHNDLWAFRPIIGTTISPQDALGFELELGFNTDDGQRIADAFDVFWTRDWTEILSTEFGIGYEFSHVDEGLFRGRAAYGVTRSVDLWCGGDVNTAGDYAAGVGVSYHFGGTGRHAALHNIGGSGNGLYTPFPTADFPELLHRTR
jgi:hypothetical protein